MTTRKAGAERTHDALIEAGLALAERTGLAGMSVNLIVEEAGVSKGSFFHHFGDRGNYLLALHRGFHERLFVDIMKAIDGMEPGYARLIASANAYLDGCQRDRGVKALLLEARAEPLIASAARERNIENARVCEADFIAMGWQDPASCALLWVGLVSEAALVELANPGASHDNRASLSLFLGGRR